MSEESLRVLVAQVLTEPDLWPGLLDLQDRELFASAVARLAASRGLDVSEDDVHERLRERRREWFERWV
jgi:hypothetical protein